MPASDSAAHRHQLIFAGLWFLGIPMILQLVSSIYFLNLATTGLNPTAGFMAIFLLPWLSPMIQRPGARLDPLVPAILFAALAAASLLWQPAPVPRVLLCIAGLVCLLVLLLRIRDYSGAPAGIIAGVALSGLYLAAGDTYRPALSVDIPVVLVASTLWLLLFRQSRSSLFDPGDNAPSSGAQPSGAWLPAACLAFWIFSQFYFFQFPGTIQAWTSLPVPLISALLLGAALLSLWDEVARLTRHIPSALLFAAGAVAALDLSRWRRVPSLSLMVLFFLLFEAWKALAARMKTNDRNRTGLMFGLPSTLIMLLAFAWIFTVTYDQAKLLGSEYFRDKAPLLFFLISMMALLPLLIRKAIATAAAGLTILCVCLAGTLCLGFALRHSNARSEPPAEVIRAATYNIYQGFDPDGFDNRGKLLDFVQSQRVQLLGLEESDTSRPSSRNGNIAGWLAHRAGAGSFFGPNPALGSYGVSVISQLPILETSVYPLPSEGEQAHLVRARLRWGARNFEFLVTHFGLSDADHTRQMEETIRLVRALPGPKILAGDFNIDPRRSLDRRLLMRLASETGMSDVLAPEGYDAASASMAPTHIEGGRIDTLFVSPDFRIVKAHPLPDLNASDHFPVIADLQWRP